MARAIFIPRRMSSAEVWPSCWPTAVPRASSALGSPKAPPQVRDLAQLDARADDLQQQRATEDADRVLVHLVAEPAAPVASVPGIPAFTPQLARLGRTERLHAIRPGRRLRAMFLGVGTHHCRPTDANR